MNSATYDCLVLVSSPCDIKVKSWFIQVRKRNVAPQHTSHKPIQMLSIKNSDNLWDLTLSFFRFFNHLNSDASGQVGKALSPSQL